MTAKILKLTAKSFISGESLCQNIPKTITLTPKRSLSQNPSLKKCLTTMVASKTKDRMESLSGMKFTMQTKGAYGSVVYVHLRHLPPPIEVIVAFYLRVSIRITQKGEDFKWINKRIPNYMKNGLEKLQEKRH